MMKKPVRRKNKTSKNDYELIGGVSASISAILIISIFLGTSLDSVLIRSQQYASVIAAVLVDMANTDRTDNSLSGLTINPVLVDAAQRKANDMATKGYFAHVSPDGTDPWHWFQEAGYKFSYAGENLAIDFSDSRDVNTAWMNSPTHRANILDKHFTEIGIATAQGMYQGRPTTFVVQEFGTPSKTRQVAAVVKASVPESSQDIALASSSGEAQQVLGESIAQKETQKIVQNKPVAAPETIVVQQPQVLAQPTFTDHLIASPRSLMHYLYYIVGALLLIALAIVTELEFHVRHIKKAVAVGTLFVLMALLLFVGERTIFSQPTIYPTAATASVGSITF